MKRLIAIGLSVLMLVGFSADAVAWDQSDLRKLWETNQCPTCDLAGANLYGLNLTKANLTEANLTGAILRFANLTKANLSGANLSGANLTGSNLTWADLTGTNLSGAILYQTDLTEANLTKANLSAVNLSYAELYNANLIETDLTAANLYQTDLTEAILCQTTMPNRSTDNSGCDLIAGTVPSTASSSGSKVVWCATANWATNYTERVCKSVGGKSYSSEYLAKAEHKRLKAGSSGYSSTASSSSSGKVWCATKYSVSETSGYSCTQNRGKVFYSYNAAKAEQNRLKGASTSTASSSESTASRSKDEVWCATALGVTWEDRRRCYDKDGNALSTRESAEAYHNRLKAASTPASVFGEEFPLTYASGSFDANTLNGHAEDVRIALGEGLVCRIKSLSGSSQNNLNIDELTGVIGVLTAQGIFCSDGESNIAIDSLELNDIPMNQFSQLKGRISDADVNDPGWFKRIADQIHVGSIEIRGVEGYLEDIELKIGEFALANVGDGLVGKLHIRNVEVKLDPQQIYARLENFRGLNFPIGTNSSDLQSYKDQYASIEGVKVLTSVFEFEIGRYEQPKPVVTNQRMLYEIDLRNLVLRAGRSSPPELKQFFDRMGADELVVDADLVIDAVVDASDRRIKMGVTISASPLFRLALETLLSIPKYADPEIEKLMEMLVSGQYANPTFLDDFQTSVSRLLVLTGFESLRIELENELLVDLVLDFAQSYSGKTKTEIRQDIESFFDTLSSDTSSGIRFWDPLSRFLLESGTLVTSLGTGERLSLKEMFDEIGKHGIFSDKLSLRIVFSPTDLSVASETERRKQEDASRRIAFTGTSFIVSNEGHAVTNYHVVEECDSISVNNNQERQDATLVAHDKKNDIALLRIFDNKGQLLFFREGRGLRVGGSIAIYGFPLHGLLSDQGKLSTGIVNSLAGLRGDSRFYQISAPVQPGNSGGPVFDEGGNVVGVVTSKLDAVAVMKKTDDIPQNVNFALKASVVRDFLDAHSIEYDTRRTTKYIPFVDIANMAGQSTILVECWQ